MNYERHRKNLVRNIKDTNIPKLSYIYFFHLYDTIFFYYNYNENNNIFLYFKNSIKYFKSQVSRFLLFFHFFFGHTKRHLVSIYIFLLICT